ncbi:putative reverse transcriptase domain-containing protein [Tanacetum coccineum]
MALREVVTNLPLSTPGLKGLENRSLNLLAPQPLQLMLKTRLLTLRSYLRFWDVLMNSRLGWQVTSWKEILSIGGRLLNKSKEVRHMWLPCHGRTSVTSSFCCTFPDGTVNTEFTDVAQVANAARNMEILRERVATVIRSHGRTKVSSTTVLLGLQVRKDTRTMPPLLHVTHVGNFKSQDQAANSSGTVSGTLFLNGRAVFVLFDTGATHSVSDHEYQNCPLRFDDKIRFANLLPLEMSDFDIILGMDWLAEHRAPIVCYTNRVIFGDLNNPEFIYLFQFRGRNFLFRGEEL